ncbi:MAG TPA: glycosyltransferase family 2 protein [Candidatus Solibacter sp.]|jgi:N-acetylglucosaminyl-diphospho-decaprenol L-rhamnosyltransferase|nr:glycosyltransferase family 2 protein [Candidatus Solibacter sp.]
MDAAPPGASAGQRSLLERTAALIVNYNTGDVLLRCLRTIQPGRHGLETVVVDNGSTDGSVEATRRDFAGATIVETGSNLGFGKGVNLGSRQTEREFLLILNPDCFIEPDSIARLAAVLDGNPMLGFVGPRIDLESGLPDHASLRNDPDPLGALIYFSRLPRLLPGRPSLNRYSLAHADYDAEQELRAGTAACLMVRASAFAAVGGFDEAFFMYGEDLDLCRRLWDAGRPGRYVPSARALHLKGEASRKQSGRMLVEFHRAMWTYYAKHERPRHAPPLNWMVAAGITALAGGRLAVNRVRREKAVSRR